MLLFGDEQGKLVTHNMELEQNKLRGCGQYRFKYTRTLLNLRFLQRYWSFKFCGMWRRVNSTLLL